MTPFARIAASVFILCSALPATAADLVGRYKIEGSNAVGANVYRGEAEIIKSGQTFQVAWKVGGQQFRGTGVLTGSTFSVVLRPQSSTPLLAVYQLKEDGTLVGVWTPIGGISVGAEMLTPEDRK